MTPVAEKEKKILADSGRPKKDVMHKLQVVFKSKPKRMSSEDPDKKKKY